MQHGLDGGLYDPASEHDSCGFGLIAQVAGDGSRAIVDIALDALARMAHRGGIAADGLSGDGCGVLLHGVDGFVRLLAADRRIGLHAGPVAAGNVFLPRDAARAAACRTRLDAELASVGAQVAGWRVVPVDPAACGRLAQASMPAIEQVFVESDEADADALERQLFLARKRTEQALREDPDFYVVGLSPRLLGYKGMVLPDRLQQLFPDLADPRLAARAVVFHQRFSTNTLPRWPLAHPFGGSPTTAKSTASMATAAGRSRAERCGARRCWTCRASTSGVDARLRFAEPRRHARVAAARRHGPAQGHAHPDAAGHAVAEYKDADLAAFYEYYAINSEPWDGPAAW